MTISDHICTYLLSKGYRHVFGLTGGGIARMYDSASRVGLIPIYLLHEQSASMAAVAYSMLSDYKGLCFVTTGPGGTNAMTGLLGSYQDSVPCLFISGQARSSQTSYGKGIRQGAVQDFHILDIVGHMTKYSKLLLDAIDVEYTIDHAIVDGISGRSGPSWIDIPIDVQWKESSNDQSHYIRNEYVEPLIGDMDRVIECIRNSKRPVILVGYGCRLAGVIDTVVDIARENSIPIITTWNTMDVLYSSHPLYLGVVGTMGGRRGANMAMCNADLLLALGTRLPVTVTGNLPHPFSKDTIVVCINNDSNELEYRKEVIDISIYGDVSTFINSIRDTFNVSSDEWYTTVGKYKELNSVYIDHSPSSTSVNPYIWASEFSKILDSSDTVVIDGGGTILSVAYGSLNLSGQRAINLCAIGCMGTGLPMGIGACYATRGRIIVMCGDGSLMLNIHDLATISSMNLPIKIFIQDNSGYLAIRNTQDTYFSSNYQGSHESGGLHLPDLRNVINGFGIPVWTASSNLEAEVMSSVVMNYNGPAALILKIDERQVIAPTPGIMMNDDGTSRSLPLCSMSPLRDDNELMYVKY